MELFKSECVLGGGHINKFSLKREEDKEKYLNLIKILYKSSDNNAVIIHGLYNYHKDTVLKVGFYSWINKEYEISKKLQKIPNKVRYYCKFMCYDNIIKIINNEYMITNYKLCESGTNQIGILAMNYYKLGSVATFVWTINNFLILKNILKQTIFAVLLAYEVNGFINGDLHAGNVLLKETGNQEIDYVHIKLLLCGYEARIMDFEKSKINEINSFMLVVKNIQKLLNSVCDLNNLTFNIGYDQLSLRKLLKEDFCTEHYFKLQEIVDSFVID
jgi:hypothetical protein